jgi:hypothetical protein
LDLRYSPAQVPQLVLGSKQVLAQVSMPNLSQLHLALLRMQRHGNRFDKNLNP